MATFLALIFSGIQYPVISFVELCGVIFGARLGPLPLRADVIRQVF